MTETKKLLDNGKVEVTTVNEIKRYTGRIAHSQHLCEMVSEDFKEQNKVWMTKRSREGFDVLDTKEDWEPEAGNVVEDIASFQKYLDDTYGKDKYEAYAIGAYVHSDVSFAFNKSEDTRCRWDSGTCGFVGINKELNIDLNKYASNLSDAWNGYLYEYVVYDNLTDEIVDDCCSLESDEYLTKWKTESSEKYGIDWNNADEINEY